MPYEPKAFAVSITVLSTQTNEEMLCRGFINNQIEDVIGPFGRRIGPCPSFLPRLVYG